MTIPEAIETIKIAKAEVEWEYPMDYQIAFDLAIDALDKMEPRRPEQQIGLTECGTISKIYLCRSCGRIFKSIETRYNYCPDCGQKIRWN